MDIAVIGLVGEVMHGEHTFERGGIGFDVALMAHDNGHIERSTARIDEQMRCRRESL